METVSVTIDGVSTSEWGIITNIKMGLPKLVEKIYTVPGRDGVIDASEALTGYPVYGTRSVEFDVTFRALSYSEYQQIYDEINQLCHGRRRKLIFSYDPNYYYDCRLTVDETQSRLQYGTVTIKGTAEPYALACDETIVEYDGAETVMLENAAMPAEVTVEADAEVSITRSGTQTTYSAGTHRIIYPMLAPGGEEFEVSGTGAGCFRYRKGKI